MPFCVRVSRLHLRTTDLALDSNRQPMFTVRAKIATRELQKFGRVLLLL